MTQDEMAIRLAVLGIVVAAAVNTLIKGGMAYVIGGRALGIRVLTPLFVAATAGLAIAWVMA